MTDRACTHCGRVNPPGGLKPKLLFGRRDGKWECRDTRACMSTTNATIRKGRVAPRMSAKDDPVTAYTRRMDEILADVGATLTDQQFRDLMAAHDGDIDQIVALLAAQEHGRSGEFYRDVVRRWEAQQ